MGLTDPENSDCGVVLGVQHRGLAEGLQGLLETVFDPVVIVADVEALVEVAGRTRPRLAVVNLSLGAGDIVGLLQRLRKRFPDMKVIVLSCEDAPSVERAVVAAGADRLITLGNAAFDLLPAAEALLAEPHYEES